MIVSFTCRYARLDPERSCRCCCRGSVVSLRSTIFTESGIVVVHCLVRISKVRTPMLQMILQSCLCRTLASAAWSSSQLTLCLMELRIYDRVVDRSQSHCCVGIVCKQLLLSLLWCWWGCTWCLLAFVRVFLHPRLCLLQLAVVRLWVLLLLSLMPVVALYISLSMSPMYAVNLYFHSSNVP